MPGAMTIEELLKGVGAYQAGSEAATQQVVAALGTQQKLNEANAETYKQQATDDATVAAAKNAADYATQLAKVKAANAMGTNLKNSTEVITGLASAADDAFKRKAEALNEIDKKRSISFLDHPIDYIAAQFTVESDITQHNLANAQLKQANDRIAQLNAATQQTVITQNMLGEPLTAASMEAATRTAAAAATVAARNAEIQGLSYGTRGIEFALNAKKEVLAFGFQARQAIHAEQAANIAMQNLELNKQEFEQRKKQYAEQDADKHEQQALGQSVLDTVNLGRKALLGAEAPGLDDVSGKMIIAALKGKGTLSTEMQKYYDAGERTRLAGTVVIGTTPSAAAETMQSVPVKLNPAQGPIKNLLAQAAQDTSVALKNVEMPGKNSNPVFAGMDKKDKSSINAAYNAHAQQLLNEASKVVKPGDSDNPYQIGSINQLAEASPTIQALPVYQKVLAPLIKNGVHLNDPKQVVSIVGDAVAKGTITHAQAIELTTIYHVGVAANLAMRNFQGFGLVPKRSYNAQVETNPDAWTPTEVVDMTQPDAVSRALLKRQASILRDRLMSGQANIFTGKSDGTKPSELFNPSDETRRKLQFGPQSYNFPDAGVMSPEKK